MILAFQCVSSLATKKKKKAEPDQCNLPVWHTPSIWLSLHEAKWHKQAATGQTQHSPVWEEAAMIHIQKTTCFASPSSIWNRERSSGANFAVSRQQRWSVTHKLVHWICLQPLIFNTRAGWVLPVFQDPELKVQVGADQEAALLGEKERTETNNYLLNTDGKKSSSW